MIFEDRERAGSFGEDAAQYDRARPGYPAALFDDLMADPAGAVVDVGCGTGIVGRLLAARGCSVIGIEPDPRMAEIARGSGLTIEISTFEDWDSRGRLFDVLTAGQSWHWVNPARGAMKAAAVLRSRGRFGLFWNGLRHDAQVAAGFERIYSRLAPHLLVDSVARSEQPVRRATLINQHSHNTVRSFTSRSARTSQRTYTTGQWLDELPTHSGHRTLPGEVLANVLEQVGHLVDGLGGEMVVDYTTAGLFGQRR